MFFARIAADVAARLDRGGRMDLSAWAGPMVQAVAPLLLRDYLRGAQLCRRRLLAAAARKAARVRTKNAPPVAVAPAGDFDPLRGSFDLLLPQVRYAVQSMAFHFVQATLQTATTDAMTAYSEFRDSLMQGVERGEALKEITVRVQRTFRDPVRAQRIAMTETSRAQHAGQVQAARESGIVKGKRWLASSDACEKCLALDGKEVPLDSPFAVNPKGGPYAVVNHPPLHPHCMCAVEEVIE